ncbi:NACHT domain-containing protein [Streptomyces sp. SD11]|uniref:NACHT domain-containing protein n=1 Tax=Streptomyces sp. SD11 TaxID=3452209 RepID=UPI003F8B0B83
MQAAQDDDSELPGRQLENRLVLSSGAVGEFQLIPDGVQVLGYRPGNDEGGRPPVTPQLVEDTPVQPGSRVLLASLSPTENKIADSIRLSLRNPLPHASEDGSTRGQLLRHPGMIETRRRGLPNEKYQRVEVACVSWTQRGLFNTCRGHRMQRRWLWTWLSCALLAIGLSALWRWLKPEDAASAASVVSAVIGLLGVMAVWAWRRPRPGRSTSGQLTEAAEALARLVRQQWREEAVARRLFDPAPLPVLWQDCALLHAVDHRQLIGDPVACYADTPHELAEAFGDLTRGRLVIVGPAGSGKTTFAILLTLALLDNRAPDAPVPVLFSLASFDPGRERVREWLRQRIAADYPQMLDSHAFGSSVIEDLLADGRILPVLDGLDERPDDSRTAVLRAFNDTLDPHSPLVVTCRTDDYAAATVEVGVLTGAAVIAPSPVRPEDALDLLRLATPPGPRQESWNALARHLTSAPHGPAAEALASPLVVALARSVYADAPGDPSELGDTRRFPTVEAVERHLLDALIPSIYGRAGQSAPTVRQRWDPHRAHRYLTFLAKGLETRGTYEWEWWQLYRWFPALERPWAAAAAWALLAAAAAPLWLGSSYALLTRVAVSTAEEALIWLPATVLGVFCMLSIAPRMARRSTGPVHLITAQMLTAAGGGLAASIPLSVQVATSANTTVQVLQTAVGFTAIYGFASLMTLLSIGLPHPPSRPRRGSLSIQQWRRRLPSATIVILAVALAGGTTLGTIASSGYIRLEPTTAWAYGLTFGAGMGCAQAALSWARETVPPNEYTTPRVSLRADRRITLVHGFMGVLLMATPIAALNSDLGSGIAQFVQLLFSIGVLGFTGLALTVSTYAWPYYSAARVVLAARGRLPWRLQTFLADAHHLGVLRQIGPVYQFRHARLQLHLGRHTRLPAPYTLGSHDDCNAPN